MSVAVEETEVFEIGHAAMKHIFHTNPDLAESISWTITERQADLARALSPPSQHCPVRRPSVFDQTSSAFVNRLSKVGQPINSNNTAVSTDLTVRHSAFIIASRSGGSPT